MNNKIKPFAIRDAAIWQSWVDANKDSYGAAIIHYAATWANLMESRIKAGKKLEDIADKTSHDADTEGITEFMYTAAVSMLSKAWEHGEALRRWHNLKTQIRDEGEKANESGGVLNPGFIFWLTRYSAEPPCPAEGPRARPRQDVAKSAGTLKN
jgi:hypothetical protein